ncbi:MAG: hypothetical protein ACE5HL_00735 [Terriglobia bacterium]
MKARGGSRLSLLLALLITAALIVGAVRIIPVYVRSYDFREAVRNQARFARVNRKPPEVIRDELLKKAQSLELPVRREQIRVGLAPGGVRIEAHYVVPVDLIIYKMDLSFDYTANTSTIY